MIEVKNVTVRYEGNAAAENIHFTLEAGQWLMVIGPNGAGKTSLVKTIARLLPYEGNVFWDGKDARAFPSAQWAQRVGLLSQLHSMEYGFTVEEVVAMGRYAYQKSPFSGTDAAGEGMVENALKMTGLLDVRSRNVLTLSGGQWQRTLLARVFAQSPSVLVLDEPANHLDFVYQKQLFDLIENWLKEGNRAVISVMHDLNLARRYGTHALLLNSGKCVAMGTVEKVFTRENLQRVYQMDVHAWMKEMLSLWE